VKGYGDGPVLKKDGNGMRTAHDGMDYEAVNGYGDGPVLKKDVKRMRTAHDGMDYEAVKRYGDELNLKKDGMTDDDAKMHGDGKQPDADGGDTAFVSQE